MFQVQRVRAHVCKRVTCEGGCLSQATVLILNRASRVHRASNPLIGFDGVTN